MRGWLDLKHSAEYCGLSVRTLRKFLGDAVHPLPAHLVGGKWLCAPEELDRWVRGFPRAGEAIDRIVAEVLKEFDLKE